MPAEQVSTWRFELLARQHDRSKFDCGEPALNEFLLQFARQNQESGVSRTFIAVPESEESESPRILGYHSIAVGAMDRSELPPRAARRFPRFPLPIVRLARLAVDRHYQGQGLGEDLLIDALQRSVRVAEEVGIIAVLIDAKHERAKAFYSRFQFEALPEQPFTLWLPMVEVRRICGFEPSSD